MTEEQKRFRRTEQIHKNRRDSEEQKRFRTEQIHKNRRDSEQDIFTRTEAETEAENRNRKQ